MSLSIISLTHVDSYIVPHNVWYNIAINYYVFNMYADSKSVYGPRLHIVFSEIEMVRHTLLWLQLELVAHNISKISYVEFKVG